MSVPLSYRSYEQLPPTSNEANAKVSSQEIKNAGYSQIEGKNSPRKDVEELNLNSDSFEKDAVGLDKLHSKEAITDESSESYKGVPVTSEMKMEDTSKESSNSKSGKNGKKYYNSYRKYNPDQYLENSAGWQMAMIRYLLDMKNNGYHVKEVKVDQVTKKSNFNCDFV